MQKTPIGRYGLFLHAMLTLLCVLVVLLVAEPVEESSRLPSEQRRSER